MPALLFYKGSGIAAWAIRKWTRSKFAHVAPCTIESKIYDAFWSTGVTVRPYDALTDWGAAIAVPVSPVTPPGWLDAQVGKRYDIAAIFLCGLCKRFPGWLHADDSNQGAWTCSRLACVWAGLETKAWGLKWPPTPEDIFEFLNQAILEMKDR
jgi:hypothetical protein